MTDLNQLINDTLAQAACDSPCMVFEFASIANTGSEIELVLQIAIADAMSEIVRGL